VRVCETCLYERTARERDELRAELKRLTAERDEHKAKRHECENALLNLRPRLKDAQALIAQLSEGLEKERAAHERTWNEKQKALELLGRGVEP
jgi:uncharacterized coiled-coil DUF342 family protein